MPPDRGVSEVLGFILVFGLVLGTISIVYVGGFSGLQDARDHEQNTNAERAFDVLATNIEEIARGDAPTRATEIKLSDATLTVDERQRVTVEVDGDVVLEPRPRPIVHDAGGDTLIVYELGAVIRVDGDSARMVREPDFVFTEDTAVVRHVDTSGGYQSVGGSTTTLVRTSRSETVLVQENVSSSVNYTLNTTEARALAWERYLDAQPSVSCSIPAASPSTVECDVAVDTISLATIYLDVDLT